MRLHECVACGSARLECILDLGDQPLANAFHQERESLIAYRLAVNSCVVCTHCQLVETAPREAMFGHYPYVSGTSATLRQYMADFAAWACERYSPASVLDIACNDGTLMKAFQGHGCQTVGIDPAENLREITRSQGLEVVQDFWSAEAALRLGRRFDLIVAMNVLGHCDDPLSFLMACKDALAGEGKIVVQTSQAAWIENGEFDCVYHEHVSYFTEQSLARLAGRAALRVAEVEHVPIHGGSMRVVFTRPFGSLQRRAERTATELHKLVAGLLTGGWKVVGYGAAAKGNTLLNFAQVPLEFIVDDNPLKWGLLTPGQNIQVTSPEALSNPERCAILLLAWNFKDEIKKRVRAVRPNGETLFILPFPEVHTET